MFVVELEMFQKLWFLFFLCFGGWWLLGFLGFARLSWIMITGQDVLGTDARGVEWEFDPSWWSLWTGRLKNRAKQKWRIYRNVWCPFAICLHVEHDDYSTQFMDVYGQYCLKWKTSGSRLVISYKYRNMHIAENINIIIIIVIITISISISIVQYQPSDIWGSLIRRHIKQEGFTGQPPARRSVQDRERGERSGVGGNWFSNPDDWQGLC